MRLTPLLICLSLFCAAQAVKFECDIRSLPGEHQDKLVQETNVNVSVVIFFRRDDLKIYHYESTNLVNYLVNNVLILLDGTYRVKGLQPYHKVLLSHVRSDLEGTAKLQNNTENYPILSQCETYLRSPKGSIIHQKSSENITSSIIDRARTCIQSKLCSELDILSLDDFAEDNFGIPNFGEHSALVRELAERFPDDRVRENVFKATFNLFMDNLVTRGIEKVSKLPGILVLSDVAERLTEFIQGGLFRLRNGYISNFDRLKRRGDVNVTNDQLKFTAETEFHLTNARSYYNDFFLRAGMMEASGPLHIYVDEVRYRSRLTLDYNQTPCRVTLDELTSNVGEIYFKLITNKWFEQFLTALEPSAKKIEKSIKKHFADVGVEMSEEINKMLVDFECQAIELPFQ